jgi:hypothetical protein
MKESALLSQGKQRHDTSFKRFVVEIEAFPNPGIVRSVWRGRKASITLYVQD